MQALKTEKIKVLTVNPAQTSTPMTWSRPDAEYLPDKMIQPDEIAEAIMMTFKLGPNVFIEVRQILTSKTLLTLHLCRPVSARRTAVGTPCLHCMCTLRATLQSHLNALTCTGISDQESLPPTLGYTGACAGDHG